MGVDVAAGVAAGVGFTVDFGLAIGVGDPILGWVVDVCEPRRKTWSQYAWLIHAKHVS